MSILNNISKYSLVLLITTAGILTGCNSNESKSRANDLSMKSVSLSQDCEGKACVLESGHNSKLTYSVNSTTTLDKEVEVSFFAIATGDSSSTDSNASENHANYLGSDIIPNIVVGENADMVEIDVPDNLKAGSYYVFGYVDPANKISEINEKDNYPEDFKNPAYFTTLNIAASVTKEVDVKIKGLKLTTPNIMLDLDNDVDGNASLTLPYYGNEELEANVIIGLSNDYIDTPVEIKAQILVNNVWKDLELWDNNAKKYVSSGLNAIVKANTGHYFAHLSMNIQSSVYNDIQAALKNNSSNEFKIRTTVNSNLETDSSLLDNNSMIRIVRFFEFKSNNVLSPVFNPANVKGLSIGYDKSSGSASKFQISSYFKGLTGVDTSNATMVAEIDTDTGFTVFNKKFTLISANSQEYCNPTKSTMGYSNNIKVLGVSLYDNTNNEITNPSTTIEKSFSKDTGNLASISVWVAIIPVTASAKAGGTVGVSATFSWKNGTFDLDGAPKIDMWAKGTAKVDIYVASTGVTTTLELITDDFHINPSITPVFSNGLGIEKITGRFKVYNNMRLVKGDFSAWAKASVPDICYTKTFLGKVPYPCIQTVNTSTSIASFGGYVLNNTLYDKEITLADFQ